MEKSSQGKLTKSNFSALLQSICREREINIYQYSKPRKMTEDDQEDPVKVLDWFTTGNVLHFTIIFFSFSLFFKKPHQ